MLLAYTTYSQANTLMSKAERLKKPIIQASYDILKDSGRTSCRTGEDPEHGEPYMAWGSQLQNPPRVPGIRECFVARPGRCVLSIDYNMHEVVCLAQVQFKLFGFSDKIAILADPKRDIHVETGALIFGMDIAEAYALKKTDPARYKKLRQMGKVAVFGCPGGLGPDKLIDFARGEPYFINLTRPEAENVIAAWEKSDRANRLYLDHISRSCGKRGGTFNLTHLFSERVRGSVGYTNAANSYFQGLGSDSSKAGIVDAMLEMYWRDESPMFGCRMLGYLHDEQLLEVPLDGLHETAYYARDRWVEAGKTFTPDVALRAEPAACLRWSKLAGDPVFDENGKLVPYEWRKTG